LGVSLVLLSIRLSFMFHLHKIYGNEIGTSGSQIFMNLHRKQIRIYLYGGET